MTAGKRPASINIPKEVTNFSSPGLSTTFSLAALLGLKLGSRKSSVNPKLFTLNTFSNSVETKTILQKWCHFHPFPKTEAQKISLRCAMGRFPIAVLGAFVPVWAYEKCGMDVPEVGTSYSWWFRNPAITSRIPTIRRILYVSDGAGVLNHQQSNSIILIFRP